MWSELYAHILVYVFFNVIDQMVNGWAVAYVSVSRLLKIETISYVHLVLLMIPRFHLSVHFSIQL